MVGSDRALEPPLAAEPELEARAEVPVAELAEVGTEAGVEGEERLAADLPPGCELGEAAGAGGGGGEPGADLAQVDGHADVLNQRALQLAGERAGEVGQGGLHRAAPPQLLRLVGRVAGDEVGDQVGLRDRRAESALQGKPRLLERALDIGDDRNLLAPHGAHRVAGLDVEGGVEVAEVPHFSPGHGEVAGHRPDLERVAPPRRIEGAGRTVGPPRLAHPHRALELHVGLGRASHTSEPIVSRRSFTRSESRKRFWNLAPRFSRRMSVVSTRSAMVGSSRSMIRLLTRSASRPRRCWRAGCRSA
jgi:hypothetical protein